MNDLIQSVYWPGVPHVESFTYSCVHGISPGEFRMVTAPDDAESIDPAPFADLLMTDGFRTVPLRDCKIEAIEATYSSGEGTVFSIRGFDRRWRWRNAYGGLGSVQGRYNQTDRRGKLVPWSIRSPEELARICLEAAGERNYQIVLPAGLKKAQGANLDRYLRLGEQFPQTSNNPEIVWEHKPPMDALAELADMFNCRVVFQPFTNRVLVVPLGYGDRELPSDPPFEMAAPSVTAVACPRQVGVYGPPPRHQFRVPLEPVGEDFGGEYVHIDQLSYAPKAAPPAKQKTTISYIGTTPSLALELRVTINYNGNTFRSEDMSPIATVAQRWATLAANMAGDAGLSAAVTGSSSGNVFTLEAKADVVDFFVNVSPPTTPGVKAVWKVAIVKVPSAGGRTWTQSPPPHFRGVLPTDRLSRMEAVSLAQGSVFRTFRIMNKSPYDRTKPLLIPDFRKDGAFRNISRLSQLIIQGTKVEQVVPMPRIAGGINKGDVIGVNDPGFQGGILPEFYNGRSRDMAPTVQGSVWKRLGGMQVYYFTPAAGSSSGESDFNTGPMERVQIPFTVETTDTGDQLVRFSDYVYAYAGGAAGLAYVKYPELVLETSFLLTDAETDQVYRWEKTLPIPNGTAPTEWNYHDDLQLGIVALYSQNSHQSLGWKYATGDIAHLKPASDAYLKAHASKYVLKTAETRQYIGIWPASPNGTIQEVTWSMGRQGPSTVVGINHEPGLNVLPYPARRRPELLPPDKAAAASNAQERAIIERMFPAAASQTK